MLEMVWESAGRYKKHFFKEENPRKGSASGWSFRFFQSWAILPASIVFILSFSWCNRSSSLIWPNNSCPFSEESESMVNMLRALEEEADLVVPYESASVAPAPSLPAPSADVAPRPKKTALASAPADPSSDPEELDEEEDNFIPPPELPAQPATVPKPVEDSINGKTFLVKILEPVGNYPTELVKTMIENIFKEVRISLFFIINYILQCKIDQSSFKYRSMRPRAEYEEQLAEWKYELTVNLDPKENTHRDLLVYHFILLKQYRKYKKWWESGNFRHISIPARALDTVIWARALEKIRNAILKTLSSRVWYLYLDYF